MMKTFILCFAFAAAAYSQERVEIDIAKPCARVPDEIIVVMNGEEDAESTFPATRTADCHWSGMALHQIDLSRDRFSLRLGPNVGRTDCHKANNRDGMIARLEFPCCYPPPVRQVDVTVSADDDVGYYMRVVPKKKSDPRSVPCTESALFEEGTATIFDVQFAQEALRLQLTDKDRTVFRPGLLVDDGAVLRNAAAGGEWEISQAELVRALTSQRAQGKAAAAPNLSSIAIDVDVKNLNAVGLQSVNVKVK